MDFCRWNSFMSEVRRLFQDLLHDDQMDAVMNVAYVYIWFSRNAQGDREVDLATVLALWKELQELQTNAAAMGVYLATAGKNLLMNIWYWVLKKIPVCQVKVLMIPVEILLILPVVC